MKNIEAFGEPGEHFDHLAKTYSSGMFVRLAFSTFIFLEPQVLLVDETLASATFFRVIGTLAGAGRGA